MTASIAAGLFLVCIIVLVIIAKYMIDQGHDIHKEIKDLRATVQRELLDPRQKSMRLVVKFHHLLDELRNIVAYRLFDLSDVEAPVSVQEQVIDINAVLTQIASTSGNLEFNGMQMDIPVHRTVTKDINPEYSMEDSDRMIDILVYEILRITEHGVKSLSELDYSTIIMSGAIELGLGVDFGGEDTDPKDA